MEFISWGGCEDYIRKLGEVRGTELGVRYMIIPILVRSNNCAIWQVTCFFNVLL